MTLYKCPHCNVQRDTDEIQPQRMHGKAKVNMQPVIIVKPSYQNMAGTSIKKDFVKESYE